MRSLAPVDDDIAFRACLLVLTRAFDLSHLRDGLNPALAPVADLFNHPSSITLPERLQGISVSGLAVQSERWRRPRRPRAEGLRPALRRRAL